MIKIAKIIFHFLRRVVAKYWLRCMGVRQIAITGSQGKTALSQGLFAMLSTLRPTVATDTNLDTIYNVPITALRVRPHHHYSIFELGIDKLGEMDKHLEIVSPDISVVTGLSTVHTDSSHLQSFDNVVSEKSKILMRLGERRGTAILNYSDTDVRKMGNLTKTKIVWYGAMQDKPDVTGKQFVSYSELSVDIDRTSFTLTDHSLESSFAVKTRLIGKFHAQTICAIYCVLKELNPYFVNNFAQGVWDVITPLKGRMSIEKRQDGLVVLDDSLRANPISTREGLLTFVEISAQGRRKVVVLADMGELAHPEEEHKKIGSLLATLRIPIVVCIGKMQKYTADEVGKVSSSVVYHFDNIQQAKEKIGEILNPSDFVYLKGSLYSRVGEVIA
jgi:UDP-N-acetylmuramoyl-tripeptide--D-alanyl-D-alanine ligase